jgi:pleiotropic regulator 1
LNDFFMTGSVDRQLKFWGLATGRLNMTLTGHVGHLSGVYCLALSPSLDLLVSSGRDSVWDIRTRRAEIVLEGHDRLIFYVLLQELQPNVVTPLGDAIVRTWDLRTVKVLLARELGLRKFIRRWVPHSRLEHQKNERVAQSRLLVDLLQSHQTADFNAIATEDES